MTDRHSARTLCPSDSAVRSVHETRQFKIETLCKKTGLKMSALYSKLDSPESDGTHMPVRSDKSHHFWIRAVDF